MACSLGSSPRMRGTLGPGPRVAVKPRIIPADAGNTFVQPFGLLGVGDHPRGCGEHTADRLTSMAS